VRRPIGGKIPDCDPFLMLDHCGPTVYGPGEAVGAPDHPHRGFETVSYIVEGSSHHKDSAGNCGELKEGWVQWMTAGSGEKTVAPLSCIWLYFTLWYLTRVGFRCVQPKIL